MMCDNLYCKIFVDTDLFYEELFALVLKFTGGKKQAITFISTQWCDISVQKNKEYGAERYLEDPENFLYWKYYLDIEPDNVEKDVYIKKISNLLGHIKDHCNDAIAACDFEDKLIELG